MANDSVLTDKFKFGLLPPFPTHFFLSGCGAAEIRPFMPAGLHPVSSGGLPVCPGPGRRPDSDAPNTKEESFGLYRESEISISFAKIYFY